MWLMNPFRRYFSVPSFGPVGGAASANDDDAPPDAEEAVEGGLVSVSIGSSADSG